MFSNMATNKKPFKISFQEAYQVFKDQNLAEKRLNDRGKSDKEIVEDILLHYGVELIKIWDENMDPEKHVSCAKNIFYFHGFDSLEQRVESNGLERLRILSLMALNDGKMWALKLEIAERTASYNGENLTSN